MDELNNSADEVAAEDETKHESSSEEVPQDNSQESVKEEASAKSTPTEGPKVDLKDSPIKSVSEEQHTPEKLQEEFLSLLNMDMNQLNEAAENYSNLDGSSGTEGRRWLTAYLQGLEHLLKGGALSEAVERGHSAWRQKVNVDGEELAAGKPRFGSSQGSVISGDKALMKASTVLGLGSVVQVPLWHTGIWVNIKAPSEASLLELDRRIANEKIRLGRYTSGMIFSNTGVYTISYVVNFVLNHVYDASVKNITQDALKDLIKATDIPLLVWGMACAIYPNGYKYARPCTANPTECQHVVEGELNLAKLSWTDNDSLTHWQRRQMTRRNEKFTTDELERYQQEHMRGGPYEVTLTDQLKMRLKVPTIAEYERSGFNWVDNIVKLLEGSLGVSLKGNERDDYIIDQGRLTALRQYGHWVDKIYVDEDVIEDEETIEGLLGQLSSQEEISEKFFEKVGHYIDDATISLIAIPKYDCPRCNGEQKGDLHNEPHPHLLPLDVVKVFFTLLDQRMFKALTRRQL